MSKITAKNLSYDTTLPPFLARMQASAASGDGRHEYDVARPKKPRNADEDTEAEPVIFDEETGETLTKEEWEKRDQEQETADKTVGEPKDGAEREKLAAIGVSKKRKMGKVVGADEDAKEPAASKIGAVKGEKKSNTVKKAKKIKLSFGDEE